MWFFKKNKFEDQEKIVEDAINELNCSKIYKEYVDCISKTRLSYTKCPKILQNYQMCTIKTFEHQKKNLEASKTIINPKLFEN